MKPPRMIHLSKLVDPVLGGSMLSTLLSSIVLLALPSKIHLTNFCQYRDTNPVRLDEEQKRYLSAKRSLPSPPSGSIPRPTLQWWAFPRFQVHVNDEHFGTSAPILTYLAEQGEIRPTKSRGSSKRRNSNAPKHHRPSEMQNPAEKYDLVRH